MKKALLLAAVTLMSGSAFASKARLSALQGSAQLVDDQLMFQKPDEIGLFGDFATVEFGTASLTNTADANYPGVVDSTTPHAEGGFVRKHNDMYYGLYLGHQADSWNYMLYGTPSLSANGSTSPAFANIFSASALLTAKGASSTASPSLLRQQNAIDLLFGSTWGSWKYGIDLAYSNSDTNKTVPSTATAGPAKQHTANIDLGMANDTWNMHLDLGLGGSSSYVTNAGEAKYNANGAYGLGAGFWADNLYWYGEGGWIQGQTSLNGVELGNVTADNLRVGVIDQMKDNGTNFFYGAAVRYDYLYNADPSTVGGSSTKIETYTVPVIVGIETDVLSWLTLRGSLTQNILLLASQTVSGYGSGTVGDSTVVAAGVGAKVGKITVDATLQAAANGVIGTDGDHFLANSSLTYNF